MCELRLKSRIKATKRKFYWDYVIGRANKIK